MVDRVSARRRYPHPEKVPNPTVLVVDENLDDVREFCSRLCKAGYTVCCVPSFVEGVACLDRRPIEFVIVSQGSPSFEGRRVLERAIEKDRQLPVLVLTRSVDMSIYLEAMQLGALDYLEKPVSPEHILKQVAARTASRP